MTMASDVFVEDFPSSNRYDLDLSDDMMFMSSGIMSPRELYLTELPPCSVVPMDHSLFKGAASSDSGVSTLEDHQDVANVTELNSVLDLKEFDFTLDFLVPKADQEDFFDAGIVIKSEPNSPTVGCKLQVSPDVFFPHEVAVKEEGSPLPAHYHYYEPASPLYSPQSVYTIEQLYRSSSLASPSPPAPLQPAHSLPFSRPPHVLVHQGSSGSEAGSSTTYSSDSSSPSPPSPASPPGFILLPGLKQDSQVSAASSLLASGCLDMKPATFNIDAIINSKIKIQPKPGAEPLSKGQSRLSSASTPHVPFTSQPTTFQHIASSVLPVAGLTAFTDEKSMKRAQRIIKNRESASLSRKRKKEYLTSLEERLQQCRDENQRLLRENDSLREQVDHLQKENSGLKHLHLTPAKKMCLMCLVFMLALNLSPYSFLTSPSGRLQPAGGSGYHPAGRHLMSVSEDSTQPPAGDSISPDLWSRDMLIQFNEELNLLAEKLNLTEQLGNMCPMYFNSTESNRLAEQLRGWMISQEKEKQRKGRKQPGKRTSYPPLKHQYASEDSQSQAESTPSSSRVTEPSAGGGSYPVQVFSGGFYSRQQLLSAIPRRNDTFYVLSFSTDYFLVPATAHNKTMRPRMSLLMPVVSSATNGSKSHGIGVMQIDCQILDTHLIHLYRSAFSQETLNNSTFGGNPTRETKDNESLHPRRQREKNMTSQAEQNKQYWEKLKKSSG